VGYRYGIRLRGRGGGSAQTQFFGSGRGSEAQLFGAAANILTLACGRGYIRHGVRCGAVLCPWPLALWLFLGFGFGFGFGFWSHGPRNQIARLLRDHVANEARRGRALAVQLTAPAASDTPATKARLRCDSRLPYEVSTPRACARPDYEACRGRPSVSPQKGSQSGVLHRRRRTRSIPSVPPWHMAWPSSQRRHAAGLHASASGGRRIAGQAHVEV